MHIKSSLTIMIRSSSFRAISFFRARNYTLVLFFFAFNRFKFFYNLTDCLFITFPTTTKMQFSNDSLGELCDLTSPPTIPSAVKAKLVLLFEPGIRTLVLIENAKEKKGFFIRAQNPLFARGSGGGWVNYILSLVRNSWSILLLLVPLLLVSTGYKRKSRLRWASTEQNHPGPDRHHHHRRWRSTYREENSHPNRLRHLPWTPSVGLCFLTWFSLR